MSRSPTCTYHCRTCESHFTSLAAFDAHRADGECSFPDTAEIVELTGSCSIAGKDHLKDVTIYQLASSKDLTEYWRSREAAQMESGQTHNAEGVPAPSLHTN